MIGQIGGRYIICTLLVLVIVLLYIKDVRNIVLRMAELVKSRIHAGK